MAKIRCLILGLFCSMLVVTSCNSEDTGFNEEPNPDPFDTLEFYSIEYDFSKKEINTVSSTEFKERLENNTGQIIPITFYPYLDQGTLEFIMEDLENNLEGLECDVRVPKYENDFWSATQTITLKTVFGETTSFNPLNGNVSITINADPWDTRKYSYIITFSELTVPYKAIFKGENYGGKYNYSGNLKIKVPVSCDIKIEETDS